MRDTFIATLEKYIESYPKTMLITGDLGFGVLDDFANKHPKNFLNVGVAEQNMTGIAAGMALEGWKVFTYSIANFSTLRCLEQIRNDVCYHELDVTILSIGGGFSYGQLGMSHHATEDISILRSLPITVLAPSSKQEVESCVLEILNSKGPYYLRLDKSHVIPEIFSGDDFNIGKGIEIKQGSDVTIVTYGGIAQEGVDAAKKLEQYSINARVISMHTIKPLDTELLNKCIQETGAIITLEEQTIDGGLGDAVAAYCLENRKIPSIFYRIGLRKNEFSSVVGSQIYLREYYEMDSEYIANKIVELFSKESDKPYLIKQSDAKLQSVN